MPAAVALVATSVLAPGCRRGDDAPDQVARSFLRRLSVYDFEGAFDLLTRESRARLEALGEKAALDPGALARLGLTDAVRRRPGESAGSALFRVLMTAGAPPIAPPVKEADVDALEMKERARTGGSATLEIHARAADGVMDLEKDGGPWRVRFRTP